MSPAFSWKFKPLPIAVKGSSTSITTARRCTRFANSYALEGDTVLAPERAMRIACRLFVALIGIVILSEVALADSEPRPFSPDPRSVQREGRGYRYPQAGWIVLHVEGEPYERGYQHGKLLSSEIAAYIKCFASQQSSKSPEDGWKLTRTLVNALFLRRFDPEYLEEMKGIADGAASAGAKAFDRKIDLVDIAALNCWAEIETLDGALEATPNGL